MKYYEVFREPGFHTALMTTFRFDAGVFENVVRPRLRANGCRNIAVLADADMLNKTYVEMGFPASAGVRYHLAKRSVSGAFHPKMLLQLGKDKGRLTVGSANLTGAGLHSNLEILEVLDVAQDDMRAAPLLAAALSYFESHTDPRDRAMRQALEVVSKNTEWLRLATAARRAETPNGVLELVSEEAEVTIADRLVDALGGRKVSRVILAAPFWDQDLNAVRVLQDRLSPECMAMVVDPEAQDFDAAAFKALEGVSLHSASNLPACEKRRFHAKLIIAQTSQGDLVLSGSANVSSAALLKLGGHGNAELCILRWELPGAAVQRLGFDDALAIEMPMSNLKRRHPKEGTDQANEVALTDGGAVFLDAAALEWQPPRSVDLSSCLIEVFDRANRSLGVGEPVSYGGRIWIEGVDNLEEPGWAVALIADERSAPMPIVSLSRLRSASNPRVDGRTQRVLDEIADKETVDIELCEQLMRLWELLQHNDVPAYRRDGSSSTKETADLKDDDRHLDTDSFGEVAPGSSGENKSEIVFRTAYDRIAQILRCFSPESTRPGAGSGSAATGLRSTIVSQRRPAEQRRSQLEQFLQVILGGLETRQMEPLSITALTMVQAFISTIRLEAAGTDEGAGEERAFGPTKPGGGWVRMLGRCLSGFVDAIPLTMSEREVEQEQIEVLAQVIVIARIVFERSQTERNSVVAGSMGGILVALDRKLNAAILGHRGKEVLLDREILDAEHRMKAEHGFALPETA